MSWILLSLFSAFFLGWYDLSTKHAVQDNAVLPVLFFANLCSAAIWVALMGLSAAGSAPAFSAFHVLPLTFPQHLELLLKAAIVALAWTCSYFALKHLPVTLASPVRGTAPMWTLLGALLLLGERPTWLEMLGIAITLASFFGLSAAGAHEGIHFHRNRWIWLLVLGTLFNGGSSLYDKFLLGRQGFSAATVQAWFSIYLALLFLPLAIGWKIRLWPRHVFHWRWSILFMSLTLLLADYIYFSALRDPVALVSLVSSLRRGSTLVAFAGGIWIFRERNGRKKLVPVIGVLIGIVLTVLG